MAYRIFVTDALRMISMNTGACMEYMVNGRFIDIVTPAPPDTRTAEQVVSDVCDKIGLEVVK